MPRAETHRDDRQDFMLGDAFIIYNDVVDKVLDHMADKPLPNPTSLNSITYFYGLAGAPYRYNCLTSSVGLFAVSKLLGNQVPVDRETPIHKRAETFGLNKRERKQTQRFTFYDGLDDLDFPWIFSAAAASATMHTFVKADVITFDEANKLQLPEWADIIDSRWFASLTRTLAHTGFAAYGGGNRFGDLISHHRPKALKRQLNHSANDMYGLRKQRGPALTATPFEEGFRGMKAVVTPGFKKLLIQMLNSSEKNGTKDNDGKDNFGGSVGCPVARHAVMLPPNYKKTMPRASRLQDKGRLRISPEPDINGNYPATQTASAIDRNLAFIAQQLRDFYQNYGEPTIIPS